MGAPAMKTKTIKELIKEERDAVGAMIAMRDNYLEAQKRLGDAMRNLSNARIALDMAIEKETPNGRP